MKAEKVNGIGLTKKIFFGFTALIILPLTFLGWKFYSGSVTLVESSLTENNLYAVQLFDEYYLGQFNNNLKVFIDLWRQDASLQKVFKNKQLKNQYRNEWLSALKGYPEVDSIYFGSASGEMFIIPEMTMPKDFDPRTRPWYKEAINHPDQINWSQPYKDITTGQYVYSVSSVVKDDAGKITGVLSMDIYLNEISGIIKKSKLGEDGYLMITNSAGQAIATPDVSMIGKDTSSLTWLKPSDSQSEGSYFESIKGEEVVVSYVTNKTTGWKLIGIIPRAELEEEMTPLMNLMKRVMLYVGAWGVISVVLLSLYVGWLIVKPIKLLMNHMAEAESGNLALEIPTNYTEEIGSLYRSFDRMIQGQKEMLIHVLVTATKMSGASHQTNEVAEQSSKTAETQLFAMNELSKSIEDMSQAITDVSINMTGIANSMEEVTVSLQEMGSVASDVAGNMVETSGAVSDVVHSIQDLDNRIDVISFNAKKANEHGTATTSIVNEGKLVVDSTMKEMEQIHFTMKELSTVITELGMAAEQIGEIVEVIDDISEQTNLLSLNASIEAARAGEHGKGFAVVASAISRLSEKSSDSTKDIERLIKKIQVSVKDAVKATDKSAQKIEKGVELVTHTEVAFINISDAVESSTQLIHDIAKSTEEQTHASKSIMEATIRVNDLTMHVSAASQQQLATIEEFINTAERINILTQEVNQSTVVQAANSEQLAATSQSLNEMTIEVSTMSNEVEQIASEMNQQSKDLVDMVSKFKL